MTNSTRSKRPDGKYEFTIWGKAFIFPSITQMLVIGIILYLTIGQPVTQYIKLKFDKTVTFNTSNTKYIDENTAVNLKYLTQGDIDLLCDNVITQLKTKFVTINTFQTSLSNINNQRLEDFTKTQDQITDVLMEQEIRLKRHIDARTDAVTKDFTKIVKELLNNKLESYYNTDTTNTSITYAN